MLCHNGPSRLRATGQPEWEMLYGTWRMENFAKVLIFSLMPGKTWHFLGKTSHFRAKKTGPFSKPGLHVHLSYLVAYSAAFDSSFLSWAVSFASLASVAPLAGAAVSVAAAFLRP